MPPKKTSTSEAPVMTQAAIKKLVADSVTAALEAQAEQIAWTELKRLLTNKYCPRTEVRKMEDELYNLTVKGSDLKPYVRRFQELAVLCPNMVPNTEKLLEAFIGGLPTTITPKITTSKPTPTNATTTTTKITATITTVTMITTNSRIGGKKP
ncbi:reverse transcriptase domain-containing protein, partial [Tanacetum coccineum]